MRREKGFQVPTDGTVIYVPPGIQETRLATRSLAWVDCCRVALHTYGAVGWQLAGLTALLSAFCYAAPATWFHHSRLCLTESSPSLIFVIPVTSVIFIHCYETSHPSNIGVLLFYTLLHVPPLIVICLCLDGTLVISAALFTLLAFLSCTGVALLAPERTIRRQIVVLHALITLTFTAIVVVILRRGWSWCFKIVLSFSVLITCLAVSHFHEAALAVRYETPLERALLAAVKVFLSLIFTLLMVLRIMTLRTFLQTYFSSDKL